MTNHPTHSPRRRMEIKLKAKKRRRDIIIRVFPFLEKHIPEVSFAILKELEQEEIDQLNRYLNSEYNKRYSRFLMEKHKWLNNS